MYLPMVILLLAGVIAMQLFLCFRQGGHSWVTYLPVMLTALADAICWIIYIINYHSPVYGAAMASFVFGILLLMAMGGELLVLLFCAVIHIVQKQNKKFVMYGKKT